MVKFSLLNQSSIEPDSPMTIEPTRSGATVSIVKANSFWLERSAVSVAVASKRHFPSLAPVSKSVIVALVLSAEIAML